MEVNTEIESLKEECLRHDGKPRKTCDLEKLRRLVELQAEQAIPLFRIESSPDNNSELRIEYDLLVKRLFNTEGEKIALKPRATEKDLSRFVRLRDMIRQANPGSERIEAAGLPTGEIQIRVKPGAPVLLEGRTETGWKALAHIMPQGGIMKIRGKYEAFRISRDSDKPDYVELKASTANPNPKKQAKQEENIYDINV